MKPVICFEMLYSELTPAQKIVKIAECGFTSVEFEYSPLNDSEKSLRKIRSLWDRIME